MGRRLSDLTFPVNVCHSMIQCAGKSASAFENETKLLLTCKKILLALVLNHRFEFVIRYLFDLKTGTKKVRQRK